jgi:HEAT repeat protein
LTPISGAFTEIPKEPLFFLIVLLIASCAKNPYLDYKPSELMIVLQSPNARNRKNAARALEALGPDSKEAIPVLVEALFDSEKRVRVAARDALVSIGPGAVEPLLTPLIVP